MLMDLLYFAASRGTVNVVAGEVSQNRSKRCSSYRAQRCPARAGGGCVRPAIEDASMKLVLGGTKVEITLVLLPELGFTIN